MSQLNASISSEHTESIAQPQPRLARLSFFYWGAWCACVGLGVYALAIFLSIVRLALFRDGLFVPTIEKLLWFSGLPTTIGVILMAVDLGLMLPSKRRLA